MIYVAGHGSGVTIQGARHRAQGSFCVCLQTCSPVGYEPRAWWTTAGHSRNMSGWIGPISGGCTWHAEQISTRGVMCCVKFKWALLPNNVLLSKMFVSRSEVMRGSLTEPRAASSTQVQLGDKINSLEDEEADVIRAVGVNETFMKTMMDGALQQDRSDLNSFNSILDLKSFWWMVT